MRFSMYDGLASGIRTAVSMGSMVAVVAVTVVMVMAVTVVVVMMAGRRRGTETAQDGEAAEHIPDQSKGTTARHGCITLFCGWVRVRVLY